MSNLILTILVSALFLACGEGEFRASKDNAAKTSAAESILQDAANLLRDRPDSAKQIIDMNLTRILEFGDSMAYARNLHEIGFVYYWRGDFPTARSYLEQAVKVREALRDTIGLAASLNRLGNAIHYAGNVLEALPYYEKAEILYQNVHDRKAESRVLANLGTIYRSLNQYDRAFAQFTNALQAAEEAHWTEGRAWASLSLGRTLRRMDQNKAALTWLDSARSLYADVPDSSRSRRGKLLTLDEIVNTYRSLGRYQAGLDLLAEVDALRREEARASGHEIRPNTDLQRGLIHFDLGAWEDARVYLEQASQRPDLLSGYEQVQLWKYRARISEKEQHVTAALVYLDTALSYARRFRRSKDEADLVRERAEILLKTGQFQEAGSVLQAWIVLVDSLNARNDQLISHMAQSEMRLLQQRQRLLRLNRDDQVQELKIQQQRLTIWGSSILLIVLFVSLFLLLRRFRDINRARVTITAQQADLEDLNRKLTRVVAEQRSYFRILGHDLRGPLSAYMSLLTSIIEGRTSAEQLPDILSAMQLSAKSIYRMLDNLLTWAQVQTGETQASPENVNLKTLIQEVMNLFHNMAAVKQVSITSSVADDEYVYVDPEMMRTVLRNLISNALKFSLPEGEISIRSSKSAEAGFLNLEIRDQGIGIPEEALPDLFTPSKALRRQGTEGETSTGLGLVLVKEFMERNMGSVSIHSKPRQGTTVRLRIPLDGQ